MNLVNPSMVGGIAVGLTLGFFLGRRWAEYFRAVDDGRRVLASRTNYRGRSTLAFVVGVVVIVGVALWFGSTSSL